MSPTLLMFGIPNCDTVKKARAFLAQRGDAVDFHDYKKQGVPAERLAGWVARLGWERVLNRRGLAWRKLDAAVQASVVDAASATAVMLNHPSTIKRPMLVRGDRMTIGFDPVEWERWLAERSR
jgi:arsenate reductase (glutaredoxin)